MCFRKFQILNLKIYRSRSMCIAHKCGFGIHKKKIVDRSKSCNVVNYKLLYLTLPRSQMSSDPSKNETKFHSRWIRGHIKVSVNTCTQKRVSSPILDPLDFKKYPFKKKKNYWRFGEEVACTFHWNVYYNSVELIFCLRELLFALTIR